MCFDDILSHFKRSNNKKIKNQKESKLHNGQKTAEIDRFGKLGAFSAFLNSVEPFSPCLGCAISEVVFSASLDFINETCSSKAEERENLPQRDVSYPICGVNVCHANYVHCSNNAISCTKLRFAYLASFVKHWALGNLFFKF